MKPIAATKVRRNLCQIIAQVNDDRAPIFITTSKGKGAVLIGEDEWSVIEETLYLLGIPGMAGSLAKGHAASSANCILEDDLDW